MKKIDKVVLRETLYIAIWTFIFSLLMQAVFLIIGKYDINVLFGNLLGALVAVLNFFIMGVSLTQALEKDEKEAKQTMKTSSVLRNFFMFVFLVIGILFFNVVSVILPMFFPRIAIALRPLFDKNYAKSDDDASGEQEINESSPSDKKETQEESKGER